MRRDFYNWDYKTTYLDQMAEKRLRQREYAPLNHWNNRNARYSQMIESDPGGLLNRDLVLVSMTGRICAVTARGRDREKLRAQWAARIRGITTVVIA
jgi:hypothetical protein